MHVFENVLDKVASVLEAEADERDRLEAALMARPSEKMAAPDRDPVAEPTPVEKFAAFYKERTGEDLPSEVIAKLSSDEGVAEIVAKLAGRGGARTPLGEAEDMGRAQETTVNVSRSERSKAAWERLGDFLVGQHS